MLLGCLLPQAYDVLEKAYDRAVFQRQPLVGPVSPHTRIHNVIDWSLSDINKTNNNIQVDADAHSDISSSAIMQDKTVDTNPMAAITVVRHRPRRAPPQR